MGSAFNRIVARIFRITADDIAPSLPYSQTNEPSNEMRHSSLVHDGFKFNILFSTGFWFILEFQQIDPVENQIHPSGKQQLHGIIRFDRRERGDFQITLIAALYDMIARDKPEIDEKYHSDLHVDGIKFECRQSSYMVENDLHIIPVAVDEEGWRFVFAEANADQIGEYDLSQISATKIIRNIITSKTLKWTLIVRDRSSRETYQTTKSKGLSRNLASVEFPFMAVFRERFVQAFGIELLARAAAERGLEVDQNLRQIANS